MDSKSMGDAFVISRVAAAERDMWPPFAREWMKLR